MNIRLSGQTARIRITESELEMLQNGTTVTDKIPFTGQPLSLSLIPSTAAATLSANHDGTQMNFTVPSGDIERLARQGRRREGVKAVDGDLSLTLEVDIRADSRKVKKG